MNRGFQSLLFPESDEPISVGELTGMVKEALNADPRLGSVRVVGEIFGVKRQSSGHVYFNLRDAAATLRCVMWRSHAARMRVLPNDGEAVIAGGEISVYEAGGVYQLYARSLTVVGTGDASAEFEALKKRLQAEGLFDESRKRPLPAIPAVIGVVTSSSGAALQDVVNVMKQRWPLAELLVSPTLVQGEAASAQIVAAIRRVERRCDVILLVRGGGSAEDLSVFNDEAVVRAVAGSHAPLISGVGHEVDVTLTDLAADVRAPTPSAAAMQATPDMREMRQRLDDAADAVDVLLSDALQERQLSLKRAVHALRLLSPRERVTQRQESLRELARRLERAAQRCVSQRRLDVRTAEVQLRALDPTAVLDRGYAIVRTSEGAVLRAAADAAPGDSLTVQMRDGVFGVRRV